MENRDMNDKETIKILEQVLKSYPLTDTEKEGVRNAIGILSWTKLVEGWVENRKKNRDKRLQDDADAAQF